MIKSNRLIFLLLIVSACESYGNLTFLGDISNSLKEVSASEVIVNSNLIWVIQDSGNKNNLYGLNEKGHIIKDIDVSNASNIDWEDLTSDDDGNIYIGDFGNNDKTRKNFQIYKVKNDDLSKRSVRAELISFTLPAEHNSKDFEAFFIHKNSFFIISKESDIYNVFTLPNKEGNHLAQFKSQYILSGKHNKITSADISANGETIILLNHKRLWKLTNFVNDNFFSGSVEKVSFKHDSQKEGICFKNDSTLIITDERTGTTGGNIYSFNFN